MGEYCFIRDSAWKLVCNIPYSISECLLQCIHFRKRRVYNLFRFTNEY